MNLEWHATGEWIYDFLSSEGAPAWIQAIGSLLALGIAIRVSKTAINHAASVKRKTIFAIAEAAHSHACNLRKAIDGMSWPETNFIPLYEVYHKSVIESTVKALQGIPMHELGSSKAVLAMLSLTDQMAFLGTAVEVILLGPHQHSGVIKALSSIDPNEHARRQAICSMAFLALQGNARGHLDRIDKDYESLKLTLQS